MCIRDSVIAEPMGRNTAACTGLAATLLQLDDPDATCIVLPADHLIGDDEAFRSAMAAGAALVAEEGGLLTFGVKPTRPETGYGYLEVGDEHRSVDRWVVHRLQRFVEKPDLDRAKRYLEGGTHLWNAGIFAWRTADLLSEMARQLPELAAGLERIASAWSAGRGHDELAAVYPGLPDISMDFAVMEGAGSCWTDPVDLPWSDVGSWLSMADEL